MARVNKGKEMDSDKIRQDMAVTSRNKMPSETKTSKAEKWQRKEMHLGKQAMAARHSREQDLPATGSEHYIHAANHALKINLHKHNRVRFLHDIVQIDTPSVMDEHYFLG